MAFGQPSGPPATPRQVQELLALVQEAGHLDFRDARGPLGFTQRQAAGKFTRDEADDLIGRLQGEATDPGQPTEAAALNRPKTPQEQLLERIPPELLAAELRSQGWMVIEPLTA